MRQNHLASYFTPMKQDMTYTIDGLRIRMCDEPLYRGTFLRATREHPELFSAPCPECGQPFYARGCCGSPLTGRVELSGHCSHCGWDGYVMVSGWKARSEALRVAQRRDRWRLLALRMLHPGFRPGRD